jgi:hypothetical protein
VIPAMAERVRITNYSQFEAVLVTAFMKKGNKGK